MADGKTCVYYKSFEELYDSLPTLKAKHEFHKALINRGLYGKPFPKLSKDTYWDGRLEEAYRYAEELFTANENKRAAGRKGGQARGKNKKDQENEECLKHTSTNVNGNVNVNGNGNINIDTSTDMVPPDGDQSSDDGGWMTGEELRNNGIL